MDDESKKSSESAGDDDDVDANVIVVAVATVLVGLSETALRRHVPQDFGGPFQDGSLVVAMQDLSSLSLFLSIPPYSILRRFFPRRSVFPPARFPGGPRRLRFRSYETTYSDPTAVETSKLRDWQRRRIFCSVKRVRGFPRNPCFGCIGLLSPCLLFASLLPTLRFLSSTRAIRCRSYMLSCSTM